jgi:hypothetical protein
MNVSRHRWVALGAARMTTPQAREWAGLTGIGTVDAPLQVAFSSVVCAVCGENYGDALEECLGSIEDEPPTAHLWQAFLTLAVTDEEAQAWSDPEADFHPDRPQSVAVLCVLCGQSADGAPETCPERDFWTSDVPDGHLRAQATSVTHPADMDQWERIAWIPHDSYLAFADAAVPADKHFTALQRTEINGRVIDATSTGVPVIACFTEADDPVPVEIQRDPQGQVSQARLCWTSDVDELHAAGNGS